MSRPSDPERGGEGSGTGGPQAHDQHLNHSGKRLEPSGCGQAVEQSSAPACKWRTRPELIRPRPEIYPPAAERNASIGNVLGIISLAGHDRCRRRRDGHHDQAEARQCHTADDRLFHGHGRAAGSRLPRGGQLFRPGQSGHYLLLAAAHHFPAILHQRIRNGTEPVADLVPRRGFWPMGPVRSPLPSCCCNSIPLRGQAHAGWECPCAEKRCARCSANGISHGRRRSMAS